MVDPYRDIPALYDAELDGAAGDIAYFARNAVGGPLLVLGCGTGRVCRGLEGTRRVTGLDRSAPMLARARALGGRTAYVEGDMRRFDVGRFAEAILPHGAFCFLHTRADQHSCLRSVHDALPQGGQLTIDLPAPDFQHFATPHTPERLAWEGRLGDRPARRTREVFRRALEGRVDLVDRWFVDGQLVATSTLPLQLAFPRELEWMVEAAGFWVDAMHGDHAGGPVRDGCDRLIVRAVRA